MSQTRCRLLPVALAVRPVRHVPEDRMVDLFKKVMLPGKFTKTSGTYFPVICQIKDQVRRIVLPFCLEQDFKSNLATPISELMSYEFHGSSRCCMGLRHSDADILLHTNLLPDNEDELCSIALRISQDPFLAQFNPISLNCNNVFTFQIDHREGYPQTDCDISIMSCLCEDGRVYGLGNRATSKHTVLESLNMYSEIYTKFFDMKSTVGYGIINAVAICRVMGLPHFAMCIFADGFSKTTLAPNAAYFNTMLAQFLSFMANLVYVYFTWQSEYQPTSGRLSEKMKVYFEIMPKLPLITQLQWQSIKEAIFPDGSLNPELNIFVKQTSTGFEPILIRFCFETGTQICEPQRNFMIKMLTLYFYFGKGTINLSGMPNEATILKMKQVQNDPTYIGAVLSRCLKLGYKHTENLKSLHEIVEFLDRFEKNFVYDAGV